VLNDEVGRNFRAGRRGAASERGEAARDAVKILVVDGVLGSRFSLVQAASQPGFLVDACSTTEEAHRHLARTDYALVIADEGIAGEAGLPFLEDLRDRHPETARALIASESGFEWKRGAIDRADLCFLLTKPWSSEALRRTLRELFSEGRAFATWEHVDAGPSPARGSTPSAEGLASPARHEILLRGLLAGLNSCETESEVVELLRAELSQPFGTERWLWVDEDLGQAAGLAHDWPVEEGLDPDALAARDRILLAVARRSTRVSRLDAQDGEAARPRQQASCFGVPLRIGGRRVLTGLVWADRTRNTGLVSALRELVDGLQMAIHRIREADARARAARDLAQRVSEELRTPVGALTHAVDLLRGEAERAGLPTEWVDRISSESERVARAVEHLEGEMLAAPLRTNAPTG